MTLAWTIAVGILDAVFVMAAVNFLGLLLWYFVIEPLSMRSDAKYQQGICEAAAPLQAETERLQKEQGLECWQIPKDPDGTLNRLQEAYDQAWRGGVAR